MLLSGLIMPSTSAQTSCTTFEIEVGLGLGIRVHGHLCNCVIFKYTSDRIRFEPCPRKCKVRGSSLGLVDAT